jgi:hypothetical protein
MIYVRKHVKVDPENLKRPEKLGIQDVNVWITLRGIL